MSHHTPGFPGRAGSDPVKNVVSTKVVKAAVNAAKMAGIHRMSTLRAGDHIGRGRSIQFPIAQIDFSHLANKGLVVDPVLLRQQFPHGPTDEGEFFNPVLQMIHLLTQLFAGKVRMIGRG